ncbi:MAG: hypothetical protein B6D59_04520 [Campylobacteraceae bacterium 4484_4]|nr:MAG: hypothetical protein B6D59_04520 [Campylobacteraceae bacterium 4484_4]
MKRKIREKAQRIAAHPATKEALRSLKPARNVWGILGVVLFFILPEIIAFVWGKEITAWAEVGIDHAVSLPQEYWYKAVEMTFGEPSWFNLLFGIGLLLWLFF